MKIWPHLNLIIAWTWILLGFLSGMVLGLFFHRENWLGGYSSLRRRMYRLAHISLPALGTVNLLFYLTIRTAPFTPALAIASLTFIIGAISMPICCVLLAHFPKTHALFCIPVLSLLCAALLTLFNLPAEGRTDKTLHMQQFIGTPTHPPTFSRSRRAEVRRRRITFHVSRFTFHASRIHALTYQRINPSP